MGTNGSRITAQTLLESDGNDFMQCKRCEEWMSCRQPFCGFCGHLNDDNLDIITGTMGLQVMRRDMDVYCENCIKTKKITYAISSPWKSDCKDCKVDFYNKNKKHV